MIGELLKINISITHLYISDNGFNDRDAIFLAEGIEQNDRMVTLDISHNEFSEEGG